MTNALAIVFFAIVCNADGECQQFRDKFELNLQPGYTEWQSTVFQCGHLLDNHTAARVASTPRLKGFTYPVEETCAAVTD